MNISCLCVGSLPLVLTKFNDVSPPGNHSVRIVASTGPEATVLFFIDSNAVNTGECTIIIIVLCLSSSDGVNTREYFIAYSLSIIIEIEACYICSLQGFIYI